MVVGGCKVQVVATVCLKIGLAEDDGVAQRFPRASGEVVPIVRFCILSVVRAEPQTKWARELLLERFDL